MKKLVLLVSMVVACDSFAAEEAPKKEAVEAMKPWSSAAKERLNGDGGLKRFLTLAKFMEEPQRNNNGAYKVLVRMAERLKDTEPHALPSSRLAQQFLTDVTKDKKYVEALELAKQKHKAALADATLKAESNQAWTSFRLAAAGASALQIEARSEQQALAMQQSTGKKVNSIKFNRGQQDAVKIFTQNQDLDPNSYDAENLEAATLALFGFWDVQEREKELVEKEYTTK